MNNTGNAKVFHIVFDGNKGGDWWTVIDEDFRIVGGAQYLREIRKCSIDKKLHRGIHSDHEPIRKPFRLNNLRELYIANTAWEFYKDTIRWFISDKDTFWR